MAMGATAGPGSGEPRIVAQCPNCGTEREPYAGALIPASVIRLECQSCGEVFKPDTSRMASTDDS